MSGQNHGHMIAHLGRRIRDLTNEINQLIDQVSNTPGNSRPVSPVRRYPVSPQRSGSFVGETGYHAGPSSPRERSRSPVSRNKFGNKFGNKLGNKRLFMLKVDLHKLMLI